jgi:DNA-directed RNA polymerase specialized sigma24 family protein
MDEDHDFLDLIRRVRVGDHTASAELVKRYAPAVRRVIRLKMRDSRLRRVLDSTDICQCVLASFFIRAASGQYDLERPVHLLRLLVVMARNKLVKERRTYYVKRRAQPGPALDAMLAGLAAPDTGPSDRLAWKDLLQEVRCRLTDDERRLADRRAEQREWSEIAAEVGGSAEALRKRLARALDRVSNQLGLEE